MARSEPTEQPPAAARPARLTGSAAIRLHLTLALGLAICIGAFCFEVLRALGGNTLSWAYVFEWPAFAGFALYMWWSLLNGRDRRAPFSTDGETGHASHHDDEYNKGLEAWNRYVRELDAAETEGLDPRA